MRKRVAVDHKQRPAGAFASASPRPHLLRFRAASLATAVSGALAAGRCRAAQPRPARGRWRSLCRAPRDRRRPRPNAWRPVCSAANDRCAARHRAASGFANSSSTYTSASSGWTERMASRQPWSSRRANRARVSGCKQRILAVGVLRIDIAIGRHDVEVAGEHDRHVGGKEFGRVRHRAGPSRRACR